MSFLYSGSFNPTTQAHASIMCYFIKKYRAEIKINFTGNDYPKKDLISVDSRIDIFNSMIVNNQELKGKTEIFNPTGNKSISTLELINICLKKFNLKYQQIIVGEDVFLDMINWDSDLLELSKKCIFYVVKRNKTTTIEELKKYAENNNLTVAEYIDIIEILNFCKEHLLMDYTGLNPIFSGTQIRELFKKKNCYLNENLFGSANEYFLKLTKYYSLKENVIDIKGCKIINNNILIHNEEYYDIEYNWVNYEKGLTVYPKEYLEKRKFKKCEVIFETKEFCILKSKKYKRGEKIFLIQKEKLFGFIIEEPNNYGINYNFDNFNEEEKTFELVNSYDSKITFNYNDFYFLNDNGIKLYCGNQPKKLSNKEIFYGNKFEPTLTNFKIICELKSKKVINNEFIYLLNDYYVCKYDSFYQYTRLNQDTSFNDYKNMHRYVSEKDDYCYCLKRMEFKLIETQENKLIELLYSEKTNTLYCYNVTDGNLINELKVEKNLLKSVLITFENIYSHYSIIIVYDMSYLLDIKNNKFDVLTSIAEGQIKKIKEVFNSNIFLEQEEVLLKIKRELLKLKMEEQKC